MPHARWVFNRTTPHPAPGSWSLVSQHDQLVAFIDPPNAKRKSFQIGLIGTTGTFYGPPPVDLEKTTADDLAKELEDTLSAKGWTLTETGVNGPEHTPLSELHVFTDTGNTVNEGIYGFSDLGSLQ